VVQGGRRFSFTALVVVGDGDGTVGVGYGKAKEVPAAIAKGVEEAKKHFFKVPRIGNTIPHPVITIRVGGGDPPVWGDRGSNKVITLEEPPAFEPRRARLGKSGAHGARTSEQP
jgi:hypothetical protein